MINSGNYSGINTIDCAIILICEIVHNIGNQKGDTK